MDVVHYSGLKSHRDHALAQKYFGGKAGGVFTFDLHGTLEDGQTFLEVIPLYRPPPPPPPPPHDLLEIPYEPLKVEVNSITIIQC